MTHYTDDDLTLYYYGEVRRPDRIERHLETCAACAALYREVAGTLAMVAAPEPPQRGDQYGLEVWQRIRHDLPAREASWWAGWLGRDRLAIAALAAALVIVAVAAGRWWPQPAAPPAPIAGTTAADGAADVRERVLFTSVADHLDRSARVLTDIMNAPASDDLSTEQAWADDLLGASRLYRRDAEDLGERAVASVLDELERSLIEIVHSPARATAADLEQIRRRMDAAALLFKVRMLSDDLRRRESAPAEATRPRTPTRKTS